MVKKRIIVMLCICAAFLTACSTEKKEGHSDEYFGKIVKSQVEEEKKRNKMVIVDLKNSTTLFETEDRDVIDDFCSHVFTEEAEAMGEEQNAEGLETGEKQYSYILYQEPTVLLGEDRKAEPEYKEMLRITTYKDAPLVEYSVNSNVIHVPFLAGGITLIQQVTKDTMSYLNDVEKYEQYE